MACNPRKDMSAVLAKGRVNVLATRHFFSVYLWRNRQSLDAAQIPYYGPAAAYMARMSYYVRPKKPSWMPVGLHKILPCWLLSRLFGEDFKYTPKLGEIHFYAGGWDEEFVSHECGHAAITAANALGVSPARVFRCDGSLSERFKTTQIYRESGGAAVASLSDEELFCYCLGDIFRQTYRWLWENDEKRVLDEKEISVE